MPALREVEQEHGSLLRVVIHHLAQNHERPDSAVLGSPSIASQRPLYSESILRTREYVAANAPKRTPTYFLVPTVTRY